MIRFYRCSVLVASAVLLASCGHARAYGIPGATQRSPDLALPLSAPDVAYALWVLDGGTPVRGKWPPIEEAAEQPVSAETKQKYVAILEAMTSTTASPSDLAATGRIGKLFDSKGADAEALDARFRGDVQVGDLRVGRKLDHLFVFYRRYPLDGEKDASCGPNSYCRLVIVKEVATRRD